MFGRSLRRVSVICECVQHSFVLVCGWVCLCFPMFVWSCTIFYCVHHAWKIHIIRVLRHAIGLHRTGANFFILLWGGCGHCHRGLWCLCRSSDHYVFGTFCFNQNLQSMSMHFFFKYCLAFRCQMEINLCCTLVLKMLMTQEMKLSTRWISSPGIYKVATSLKVQVFSCSFIETWCWKVHVEKNWQISFHADITTIRVEMVNGFFAVFICRVLPMPFRTSSCGLRESSKIDLNIFHFGMQYVRVHARCSCVYP